MLLGTSCATIKRAFSQEDKKSDISAAELTQQFKPDGTLLERFHPCSVEGPSKRRLMIYLPAGYETSGKRYPTVYLLHGARGNETSWLTEGFMTRIVDSLTREGLIQPAIYVMANMNSYKKEEDGLKSTFKTPLKAVFETDGSVETAFRRDVVDYIDANFRTIADKEHRALAGLSIGSFQSIFISAHNPDTFDYVGLFSPIFKSPVAKGKYRSFYNRRNVRKLQKTQFDPKHCPKLYLVICGTSDIYFFHSEYIRQYLHLNKYNYEFMTSKGGHTWDNWQDYLDIYLQKCFKQE